MASNDNDGDPTTPTKPLSIGITVPELAVPINKEARKATNALIEERFEAAMQRRHEFIEQFEQDTGMPLDATRRDSAAGIMFPDSLAKAQHGAIQLLLEAWYEQIGIQDAGWTRYNEKTTPRACRMMRQILENGDEELGIPISALEGKKAWVDMLKSIKWWFFSLSVALDFLAAYGIGDKKFGSGLVRVEILNYASEGRCISGSDHYAAMLAWKEGEAKMLPSHFPPIRPCACYEYRLLMKTICNAKGLPAAGDERIQKTVGDQITKDWLTMNKHARFDIHGWPTSAEGQYPARVAVGDKTFEVRYYKGKDEEKGIFLRAARVEGHFGELL